LTLAAGRLSLAPATVDADELVNQSIQVVQAMADTAEVKLRSDVQPLTVFADADMSSDQGPGAFLTAKAQSQSAGVSCL
jgi:hypothetical protein